MGEDQVQGLLNLRARTNAVQQPLWRDMTSTTIDGIYWTLDLNGERFIVPPRCMDAGSPTTSGGRKEQTDKIVRACAEACGVEHGLIAKIGSTSEEQERRMKYHIRIGSLVVKFGSASEEQRRIDHHIRTGSVACLSFVIRRSTDTGCVACDTFMNDLQHSKSSAIRI